MNKRALYWQLWTRMALAAAIGLLGLGFLAAVELALGTWVGVIFVESAEILGGVLILIGLIGLLIWFLWETVVFLFGLVTSPGFLSERIGDDAVAPAVASAGAYLWNPPRLYWIYGVGSLFAAGIGLVLGYVALIERGGISPWLIGLGVGIVFVCLQTVALIHQEISAEAAVRNDLEESYLVIDDSEYYAAVKPRVRRLAAQADLPVPEVRIGASYIPKAATAGYRPEDSALFVSRGLVDSLSERELEAVLAHELAHLRNRDAAVLTALALPSSKAKRVIDAKAHPAVLMVFGPVYLLSAFTVALVARYREYVADYGATRLTGDPAALASALETLSEASNERPTTDLRAEGATVAFDIVPPPWEERERFDRFHRFVSRRVFGTHPPTEARIERLQAVLDSGEEPAKL